MFILHFCLSFIAFRSALKIFHLPTVSFQRGAFLVKYLVLFAKRL